MRFQQPVRRRNFFRQLHERLPAAACVMLAIGAILFYCLPANALINPKFTPVHLVTQADTILTIKFKNPKDIANTAEMQVIETLKGTAPANLTINFSQAQKDHADAARKLLAKYGDEPGLFFAGKNGDEPLFFICVHGKWMQLSTAASGGFDLNDFDDGKMRETWNGGTDQLIRCVKYILADADSANVPSASGTSWTTAKKISTLTGPASNITSVDLAGDGKLSLFIGCEKGDHLFQVNKDAFDDVSDKLKLKSASRLSAWGDFNGDGRAALASYDGKTLTIWSQAADGSFTSAPAAGSFKLPADVTGIAALGLPGSHTASILVSGGADAPILLKSTGRNAFEVQPLAAAANTADRGKAHACVVGDFNGDSIVDVIQPFDKGGLIYLGNADGSFEAPKPCGVSGAGKTAVGDFAGDGNMDVVMADDSGMAIFQNSGDGHFEEVLQFCGEVTKAQGASNWCATADFNNDGRRDVFITHPEVGMQIFFNRGFRSFGEAPDLEELKDVPDADKGQQMATFGDFRNAGAQDLVIVLANGDVWWALNDLSSDSTLCVRARLAADAPVAGPINVSLWKESRCIGSCPVAAGGTPAYFGVSDAGAFTLKWHWPGGKEISKAITVDKPVDVTLSEK